MVLGQLITPGGKSINAAMPTIADMSQKDMPMMFGSISNTMINILLAELNLSLGLPCIQSACSHHRDNLDEAAQERSIEIFNLVNQYDYFCMRHLFGFSSQLNDFKIENMEKQLALYQEVTKQAKPIELPDAAQYDPDGMEAIFEGLERRDFRELDHTLRHIGVSFVR